jgi:hypothetical protein
MDESETLKVFATLRDWDQLLVRNILELCIGWMPATYHDVLRAEAKTELKWLEQWQSAAIDPASTATRHSRGAVSCEKLTPKITNSLRS